MQFLKPAIMNRICLAVIGLCAAFLLSAQERDPFKPEPPRKPNIREIMPGLLQVGTVLLNKNKKEIAFPVTVNMNEGPIEFLVVTGKGKTHDFKMFKDNKAHIPSDIGILGDSGYQGIKDIHANSRTPIKKPKGKKLTKRQKLY